MISTKQRTIALSVIAIAAVLVLFAAGPLVTTHQAHYSTDLMKDKCLVYVEPLEDT